MKLSEVTAYNLQSQTILNESWDMLTESQRLHVGAWEKRVWPLMEEINRLLEAELTPDQIQQIFSNAEKLSAEQGTGLTALGKAGKVTAEVSGKLKKEIEKLLDQAKNSEPVKNMDAQFDKLRSQIGNSVKDMKGGDKILQGVDKWKKFGEENPAKQAFIIGAMTSLLAFASGGAMSGAAIGFFLRLANNTLKGDQLSTAVGKGVKGAAIGAVAGAIGSALGDNIEISTPEVEGGEVEVSSSVESDAIADSSKEVESTAVALEDMTVEEYKLEVAERHAENLDRMNGIKLSPEMIQKIADDVTVQGNYPDNFTTNFEGTIVRGNIYLTPEELQKWKEFVNADDPFAPNGVLGDETSEWLKNNVEGVSGQPSVDAGADSAADSGADASADSDDAAADDSPETATGDKVTFQGGEGVEYDKQKLIQAAQNAMSEYGAEDTDAIRQAVVDEIYKQAEEQGTAPDFMIEDEIRTLVDAGISNGKGIFGELQDAAEKAGNESYKITDKDQIVESLWDEFELYEAGFADTMKKAAAGAAAATKTAASKAGKKAASAAKAGAGAAKKELGQKVTVRKLNSVWKKMGSPTDAGSIANLLADAGMSDEQIGTVAQQNKVDLPAPSKTASSAADEKDQATAKTNQTSKTASLAADEKDQATAKTNQATDQQGSKQQQNATGQQGKQKSTTKTATQPATEVDIKSLAQEIKQLSKASVKKIKGELTKELNNQKKATKKKATKKKAAKKKATKKKANKSAKKTGASQRPQGGGKVAGQQSQTPGAVRKRQQRAANKAAPQQAQQTTK